ncbi:MAG TPA: DUF4233 domain-containing protein [Actinopolymorphaceae bacterium]
MSFYGGAGRPNTGPRDPKRPMNGTLAALLLLEGIAIALSVPVMITVSNVDPTPALIAGLGLAVIAFAGSSMQTRKGGRLVGAFVQVGAMALGILTPAMAILGAVFGICWVSGLLLEDRIRRIRREKGLDSPVPPVSTG